MLARPVRSAFSTFRTPLRSVETRAADARSEVLRTAADAFGLGLRQILQNPARRPALVMIRLKGDLAPFEAVSQNGADVVSAY
jgi:hypothetical protein